MVKLLFSLSLFLAAFSCNNEDDNMQQNLFRNEFKVAISENNNFVVNDTLWINGLVSSRAFNSDLNDSVFIEISRSHQIELYKFVTPTEVYNVKDAISSFDLIHTNHDVSFLGICSNGSLGIDSNLNMEGNLYKYKLGLRLLESGDYLINFGRQTIIQNAELNLNIANNYLMPNNNSLIGFNKCNSTSSTSTNLEGIYCFKVN